MISLPFDANLCSIKSVIEEARLLITVLKV